MRKDKRLLILLIILAVTNFSSSLVASDDYRAVMQGLLEGVIALVEPIEAPVLEAEKEFCIFGAGRDQWVFPGELWTIYRPVTITTGAIEDRHLVPQGVVRVRDVRKGSSSATRVEGDGDFEPGFVARRSKPIKSVVLFDQAFVENPVLERVLLYWKGLFQQRGVPIAWEEIQERPVEEILKRYEDRFRRVVILSQVRSGSYYEIGVEVYDSRDQALLETATGRIGLSGSMEFFWKKRRNEGGLRQVGFYDLPFDDAVAVGLEDFDGDRTPELYVIGSENITRFDLKDGINQRKFWKRQSGLLSLKNVLMERVDIFFFDFDNRGIPNLVITTNRYPEGSLLYRMEDGELEFSRKLEVLVADVSEPAIIATGFSDFNFSSDSTYVILPEENKSRFEIVKGSFPENFSAITLIDTGYRWVYLTADGYLKGFKEDGRVRRLLSGMTFGPKLEFDGKQFLYLISDFPPGGRDYLYQARLSEEELKIVEKIQIPGTIYDISLYRGRDKVWLVLVTGDEDGGRRISLWETD